MDPLPFEVEAARPHAMAPEEWQARCALAACYRLFDHLGWTEGIYNHLTRRIGQADGQPLFLINPYGLHYAEVTPLNLLVLDTAGRIHGPAEHPANAAGMVIHCAVHGARHDAQCVMHTHTTAVMAVACKANGLRDDNFYSAQLCPHVAYHDFEGITTRPDEGARLVASLGGRSILMLRHHGVLVAGPSLCETFSQLWMLQRACEVQWASDSMAGPNAVIATRVLAEIAGHVTAMRPPGARPGELLFKGLVRRAGLTLDRLLQPGC
jgi:ribulose-5-phosphate 4-epimerase/fuculose-1-phosphate aldolase